jgi:hypothetical protein
MGSLGESRMEYGKTAAKILAVFGLVLALQVVLRPG